MEGRIFWYRRFRAASLVSMVGASVWTALLIIPVSPFDRLLQVMIAGGAGTWLILGYVIYLAVGVGGFAALASMLSSIESDESRVLSPAIMTVGLWALFLGVTAGCLLLGIAGGTGGYAQSVQRLPAGDLHDMLEPYVNAVRLLAFMSLVGAAATVLGIVTARGARRTE